MTATSFVTPPWHSPKGVTSELLIGPTVEPLTLDEGKLRAGLDWIPGDPRDDLMRGFITAARQKVEQDTSLALLTQTRRVTFSGLPVPAVLPLPAQAQPVQSVTVISPVGAAVAVRGRALQIAGLPVQVPTLVLELVCGWPSVAALKAEAPLLLHAVGLLTAHYATLGRDLAGTGTISFVVPEGYAEAIQPFAPVWVI